jgi:type II secretory pathway pseudopilin PulG
MVVWRGLMALIRRPALVLALAIAGILLASAVSEAVAANRLIDQVHAAQATNASLRVQLTQVAAEVRDHEAPNAIIPAARRLGWTLP